MIRADEVFVKENRSLMTVSIAMTTFDGVEYVAKQLASISAQTYKPLEIIISDDGSTDGTLQELESLRNIIPFQLFTRSSPLGVNANLAFALQQCRGDLIAIADQDDIWVPEKIQALVDALGQYDAVFSNSLLIDQYDQPLGATLMDHLLKGAVPRVGTEPLHFILQNVASGHAMLFRRKLLAYALPFVSDYYYDQQLAIVASMGDGIAYLDRALVQHRQHANNTCNHLVSKNQKEKAPRLDRATRMAIQLRAGMRYVQDVSKRIGADTACLRSMRRLSALLNANSFIQRCSLFFWVMHNREKLFPYQSRQRRLKMVHRIFSGLRNTSPSRS